MMFKEIIGLREKVYDMSNGEFPLNTFFNDIRDNTSPTFNKELAYKDLNLIANHITYMEDRLEKLEKVLKEIKDSVICPYNQDCESQCEDILKIINEVL